MTEGAAEHSGEQDHTELVAVVVTVADNQPYALAIGEPRHLPAGPLEPRHRSLQESVRTFVVDQTGHSLGFLEQLYTFADLGRGTGEHRVVSISYLGLTRAEVTAADWLDVYAALPWEDRRADTGAWAHLPQELERWSTAAAGPEEQRERKDRVAQLFGTGENLWRGELALQRYELLWEAGLVPESHSTTAVSVDPGTSDGAPGEEQLGVPMLFDHRRILATALSRLRTKLQYRPVVFELLPQEFTLSGLQQVAEALAGQSVHTQNFRRAVEQQHRLVEPTGGTSSATGGRPARLYRFRNEVLDERLQVGTKLPIPRSR
ncbi:NUDIX hydrolase [Dermacoccaceae bacterium W4C1]